MIDIEKDIKQNSYNPIRTYIKHNNSTISIEFESIYSDFINLHSEILDILKNFGNTNEEFIYSLTTSLNNLAKKVTTQRSLIIEKKSEHIQYIENLILSNQKYILAHNGYCDCIMSGCEYDGCCSKKTCYGDNCYNACCGGNCCGVDSSGCTCCGYSCWGDFCLGYTNVCDCMCGCDGGNGCCCDFDVWKKTIYLLIIGAIVYWIFGHFFQIVLFVIIAIGVNAFLFARKSKNRKK